MGDSRATYFLCHINNYVFKIDLRCDPVAQFFQILSIFRQKLAKNYHFLEKLRKAGVI